MSLSLASTAHDALHQRLTAFAGLSPADLRLADAYWTHRTVAKNEFFNFRNSVCRYVGFIVRGLFRAYYADADEQEHTLIFLREGEFLASLKSMITQEACPFYIGALEDSELLVISSEHLQQLYAASHGWERFGRLLAEQSLLFNQGRTEALLFQSAEQRYLALLQQFPGVAGAHCLLPGYSGAVAEPHPGPAATPGSAPLHARKPVGEGA